MHQTTYGYNIVDSGNAAKGVGGWFAGINANFTRLDAHSHNGIDSVLLSGASVQSLTVAIAHASWTSSDKTDGGYMQTVTAPAGVDDVNNFQVIFEFTAPVGLVGQRGVLDWVRLTSTTFKVYCNDNTADFNALFR